MYRDFIVLGLASIFFLGSAAGYIPELRLPWRKGPGR